MNRILIWIKLHNLALYLFLCGLLFIGQGIYGAKKGEFFAPPHNLKEYYDQWPFWRVNKKAAKWIGSFLILIGIGCFIAGAINLIKIQD